MSFPCVTFLSHTRGRHTQRSCYQVKDDVHTFIIRKSNCASSMKNRVDWGFDFSGRFFREIDLKESICNFHFRFRNVFRGIDVTFFHFGKYVVRRLHRRTSITSMIIWRSSISVFWLKDKYLFDIFKLLKYLYCG